MIKRLFWLLAVLLVTADSFLAADLLTSKISTKWENLTDSEVTLDAQPKSSATNPRYSDYMVVTRRNLFQTADLKKQEEAAKSLEPKPSEIKPVIPLKLKLVGTIVGTIARPWAIIQDLNTQKQDIYREGDDGYRGCGGKDLPATRSFSTTAEMKRCSWLLSRNLPIIRWQGDRSSKAA